MARPRRGPGDEPQTPNDATPPPDGPTPAGAEPASGRTERSRGTRRSSPDDATGTSSKSSARAEDPFLIAGPGFRPVEDGRPRLDVDLDDELPPPEHLFDWTPERAGAIIRAGGYVLHTADRVAHVEGGEELWKATEQDARAAGEPLARILNRYDAARRLVGFVDEAEFAAAMFDYARRNLELRGRLVRVERARQAEEPRYGPDAFDGMAGPPVDHTDYTEPPEPPPVERDDPAQPAAYAFDPWAGR